MARENFPAGKLPSEFLAKMLNQFRASDPSVIIGPAPGEDAAVLSIKNKLIALAVDPITFASKESGFYAVAVNANDIATRGAKPRWFLCSALFPEGKASKVEIQKIFSDVSRACNFFGVTSIGGHTEITSAVTRPVLTGIMVGEVLGKKALSTSGVRFGDDLILTKSLGLEAASVIAREKAKELKSRFDERLLLRCQNYLRQIGVVKEALTALSVGGVHAMHDPTEGGVSCGLYEMAEVSKLGFVIEEQSLPILKETRALLDFYGLNPLGVLSSGALLIAASPGHSLKIIEKLSHLQIPAVVIGSARGKKRGVVLSGSKGLRPFPRFARDEIAKIF